MKINRRLLPIKLHYFFFMAASGPILPYLTVYGKQLGISEVVMGSIAAVLPIAFLLAKPLVGFLADYFMRQRKLIFMLIVLAMSLFYVSLHFVPPVPHMGRRTLVVDASAFLPCGNDTSLATSASADILNCTTFCGDAACHFRAVRVGESVTCLPADGSNSCGASEVTCSTQCNASDESVRFYKSFAFYGFVTFMSLAMIAFNVANSISDAICFDILGADGQSSYGKQRVWGAVGFGIAALVAGFGMDFYSEDNIKNYTPAFVLVLAFTLVDLLCCTKLRLPKMLSSESIIRDVGKLIRHRRIIVFLGFTALAGLLDSFIIYFLFWFLEDLAEETDQTGSIKMLEGLTVAAETLGSEIIFFPLSGRILDRLGYSHSFTLCFFNYALRMGLISLIPGPWWILSVELFMQGPTYALTYTVIVAYANAVSPPGTSATMQGLVAGMDDGLGYAVGSLIGGFLYRAVGGRLAFQYYCLLSLICCIAHFAAFKYFLSDGPDDDTSTPVDSSEATQKIRVAAADDEENSRL